MNTSKIGKVLHFVIVLLFVSSCGSDVEEQEEERDLAIEQANLYLTDGNCADAIKVIEAAGDWPFHAQFLQTKASSYACRAGFSELKFWADDLELISSGTNSFIGSLTKMSTSLMTSSEDVKFLDLLSAINVLLYSGKATSPSSNARLSVFSASEVSDMNVQLLMMLMAEMGKFAFFYGNANPTTGVKGTGAVGNGNPNGYGNPCFLTYTDATAIAAISLGTTGSCTNLNNIGHINMISNSFDAATKIKRKCQGIVLFNNLIDVLGNVVVTSDPTITALTSTFVSSYNTVCATLTNTSICAVKSQGECEADYLPQTALVERYYATVIENFFR